jgi:excisionase family DNA binding protein
MSRRPPASELVGPPGALLTTRQVADVLLVSPETVLRYYRSGRLDGFRLGGTGPLRFTTTAVDRFTGGALWSGPLDRTGERDIPSASQRGGSA